MYICTYKQQLLEIATITVADVVLYPATQTARKQTCTCIGQTAIREI